MLELTPISLEEANAFVQAHHRHNAPVTKLKAKHGNGNGFGLNLGQEATLTVSGETRIGYSAKDGIVTIGNGAQLNPALSRWLMGLPRVFCDCAVTATRSARRSPKNSLKQQVMPSKSISDRETTVRTASQYDPIRLAIRK